MKQCPNCGSQNYIEENDRFKCNVCKTVFVITNEGKEVILEKGLSVLL